MAKQIHTLKHIINERGEMDKFPRRRVLASNPSGIESPKDVRRDVHAKVNLEKGDFEITGMDNLPEGWEETVFKKFAVDPKKIPCYFDEKYKVKIPILLKLLKDKFIQLRGHKQEGIFRIQPDAKECQDMKNLIQSQHDWKSFRCDVHTIACLIKIFFRELPKPLLQDINPKVWELNTSMKGVPKALRKFPQYEHGIFLWVLDLLQMVVECVDVNKMTSHNCAVCFGPNLYDSRTIQNPMRAMEVSSSIVKFLEIAIRWRSEK